MFRLIGPVATEHSHICHSVIKKTIFEQATARIYWKTAMGDSGYNRKDDIFSKPVRAGKRTYFFDVKATRGDDYYLTITESKRRMDDNGQFIYDKHKLFLYKEDFDKFAEGFESCIKFIRDAKGDDYGNEPHESYEKPATASASESTGTSEEQSESSAEAADSTEKSSNDDVADSSFSDVSFDDLGKGSEG